MKNKREGFVLMEAVLSVVIVSICLTFIAQSLLTNFRTGVRFQEAVRSLIAMENRLGLLYVTDAPEDQLSASAQTLEKPFDKFTVSSQSDMINNHLKKIVLKLNWPTGATQGHLNATTIIYSPDENPNSS